MMLYVSRIIQVGGQWPIIYQWDCCYYLIPTSLLADKNRVEKKVFLEISYTV